MVFVTVDVVHPILIAGWVDHPRWIAPAVPGALLRVSVSRLVGHNAVRASTGMVSATVDVAPHSILIAIRHTVRRHVEESLQDVI